ncbi:MAG: glycosyltransferase family 4 protein [Pseudomonadota bacterium]
MLDQTLGGTAASPNASVVFVTRKWPPAVGGMETYSRRLTEAISAERAIRVIAAPGREDGSPPSAIALVLFGLRAGWRLLAPRLAPRLTHRHTAALLHIGDMALWPLALPARLRGCRVVVLSAHGTDVGFARRRNLKGRLYRAYLQLGAWLLPRLFSRRAVIANSAATATALREVGFPATRIVPLATDLRLSGMPPTIPAKRLLFAGRLIKRKGLGWFVRSVLPGLPEEIGLDVAGTVWDADEGTALEDRRVRFLGPLPPEALAQAYREALAVIVPNVAGAEGEFEGFGLVAAEAAVAGAVVLAARRDGLVEAVRDGETGFLLPSGDAAAWQSRIIEVAGWQGEARAAFVAQAQVRAAEVYSWQRVAADTMAVYDALMASQATDNPKDR